MDVCVLTVRMDPGLYNAIRELAFENRRSTNRLAIGLLLDAVRQNERALSRLKEVHGDDWEATMRKMYKYKNGDSDETGTIVE